MRRCRYRSGKKGVALFIVLATILVVVVLANIAMTIIASQNRFTHHQVSRIQAYYAAQAGMVYAMEMLSNGSWVFGTHCTTASPCDITDTGFTPYVVNNRARVIFCPAGNTCNSVNCPGGIPGLYCLQTFVEYTFNP